MSTPYQFSVVGCVQTIALPNLPPNASLQISNMPDWANYRWIIKALTGVVSDDFAFIHEADALAAQNSSGEYDAGWWQSDSSGYAAGDVIAESDNHSRAWWTARGATVPTTRAGPASAFLPETINLGYNCTGIQITSFVYFGAFDANTSQLTIKTGDASGLNLVSLDNGYYQDTLSGKVYRPSWLPPYVDPTSSPNELSLETIVSRVCRRGGITDDDFDATDLSARMVGGYPIARQCSAADALLPLMQAYFGYASEYDSKLNFHFYGENANVTINVNDLIEANDANNGNIVSNLRNQATEFPRRIVASYMDPAQNYSVVNVFAERQALDVIAIGDQSFAIPVVMSAQDATEAANKALKVAYATLEGTLEYSTPYADSDVYIKLAAGEPLQMNGKRYIMDEMILSYGYLKMTARYDRQSAYTSNVQAILGNPPTSPSSPYSGPTILLPMNLPAQRPQDTLGVYILAASSDGRAAWKGCTVQVSYDGMQSWQNALTITDEATLGRVLADDPDQSEPLSVSTIKYDLESATTEQLAAQANALAIVGGNDIVQIIQFQTASDGIDPNTFDLTDIGWGLSGTPLAGAYLNDYVGLLKDAYFLPINPTFAGKTLYFRGVGFGESADDAAIYPLIYTALVAGPNTPGQSITDEDGNQLTDETGNILATEI